MSIAGAPGSLVRTLPVRITVSDQTPDLAREACAVLPRNEAIDVVRLFAAAGVVFVHATQSPVFDNWGNLIRFAVPFYLFASLYFQALSLRRNTKPDLSPLFAVGGHKR